MPTMKAAGEDFYDFETPAAPGEPPTPCAGWALGARLGARGDAFPAVDAPGCRPFPCNPTVTTTLQGEQPEKPSAGTVS
jgi:hypothetical protein